MPLPPRLTRPFGAFALVLGMLATTAAHAQVGYAPGHSPYRDVDAKYILSFVGGYSDGGGGKLGVGPSTGRIGGLRFDLHLAGPGNAQFNLLYGSLERGRIDPDAAPDEPALSTIQQSVILLDAGLNLALTGEKTWHGLAPYFGAGMGIALGGAVSDSTFGMRFNTKFMAGPVVGFRWHPFGGVALRVEGRDLLWQLAYPSGFFDAPERDTAADPVLDPAVNGEKQWTHNPQLTVSLGIALP